MIELLNNQLTFRFPEVHQKAVCHIDFQRTLRIPDDNREYPLPPGLGRFPLRHVDDHAERVPERWLPHGGVLLPMYQSEAMWLNFDSPRGYPFALRIAAGKIVAFSKRTYDEKWQKRFEEDLEASLVIRKPVLSGTLQVALVTPLTEIQRSSLSSSAIFPAGAPGA